MKTCFSKATQPGAMLWADCRQSHSSARRACTLQKQIRHFIFFPQMSFCLYKQLISISAAKYNTPKPVLFQCSWSCPVSDSRKPEQIPGFFLHREFRSDHLSKMLCCLSAPSQLNTFFTLRVKTTALFNTGFSFYCNTGTLGCKAIL